MKDKILRGLLIVLLLLPIGCTRSGVTTVSAIPTAPSPQVLVDQGFASPNLPRITCEQLKQKMDSGEALILVDVDLKKYFDEGHLPGSMNIPSKPEETAITQLMALPKDRLIVFYCA